MKLPYKTFKNYLHDRHGPGDIRKISVDAGLSCPNRDGSKSRLGCSYCNESSFVEGQVRRRKPVTQQIREIILRRPKDERFLLYFQAGTNTYGPDKKIIALFEEAIKEASVRTVGLYIGTRPDCLSEAVLKYLASRVGDDFEVVIELGMESANDEILKQLNRCLTHADFEAAVKNIRRFPELKIATHLIFGLPGETETDRQKAIDTVNRFKIEQIKFHQLHIVKGSQMARDYRRSPWELMGKHEYFASVQRALKLLHKDCAVQRVFATAGPKSLIAPQWSGNSDFLMRDWYSFLQKKTSDRCKKTI